MFVVCRARRKLHFVFIGIKHKRRRIQPVSTQNLALLFATNILGNELRIKLHLQTFSLSSVNKVTFWAVSVCNNSTDDNNSDIMCLLQLTNCTDLWVIHTELHINGIQFSNQHPVFRCRCAVTLWRTVRYTVVK